MTHIERFTLCFPYFGAPLPVAQFGALGTLRAPGQLLLKNHSGDQHITWKHHFLLSSHCGVTILLLGQARPRSRPRRDFLESRKRQENKAKSIKMIGLWPLKTPKCSKSAQDHTQNWMTRNRSTWPVAAHPQMTIYDLFDFCLKTTAGIKIITF